jgi:hypothetical protein
MTTRTSVGRRILVVAQAPIVASNLVATLGNRSEYAVDLVVMSNFERAKQHLISGVDLLITEVKLGAYNGLHLAVRALAAGIPSIVIGPDGDGFDREAARLGAAYLSNADVTDTILSPLVKHLLTVSHEVSGFLPWGHAPNEGEPVVAGVIH